MTSSRLVPCLLCVAVASMLPACAPRERNLGVIRSVDLITNIALPERDVFDFTGFLFASDVAWEGPGLPYFQVSHMEPTLNDVLLDVDSISSRTAIEGVATLDTADSEPLPVAPFADELRLTLRDEDEELSAVWPGLLFSPTATLSPTGVTLRSGDRVEFQFDEGVEPDDLIVAWELPGAPEESVTFSDDPEVNGSRLTATVPEDAPRGAVTLRLFNTVHVAATLCEGFAGCEPATRKVDQAFDVTIE